MNNSHELSHKKVWNWFWNKPMEREVVYPQRHVRKGKQRNYAELLK